MTEQERAALRRKIAEELGWRIVDLNDNPHGARVKGAHIVLYDPSGNEIERVFKEDTLFSWMSKFPDWTTSVDVALTLVGNYNGFVLELQDGAWRAAFMWHGVNVFATSATEALCRAWLEYRRIAKGKSDE